MHAGDTKRRQEANWKIGLGNKYNVPPWGTGFNPSRRKKASAYGTEKTVGGERRAGREDH